MRAKFVNGLLVSCISMLSLCALTLAQNKPLPPTKARLTSRPPMQSRGRLLKLDKGYAATPGRRGLTGKTSFLPAGNLSASKTLRTSLGAEVGVSGEGSTGTPVKLRGPFGEKSDEPPHTIAGRFLKIHHRLFSLRSDLSDVRHLRSMKSSGADHVTFKQVCDGIPVEGGRIDVHLFQDGRVQAVTSRIFPDLQVETRPLISEEEAMEISRGHLDVRGALMGPILTELVILPEPPPGVLAWKVSIPASQPCGDWVVTVDAQDGTVLSVRDIRMFATGRGRVFDPNPVVALRRTDLSDQSDSASAVPQAAYKEVELEGLDNTGYLRGPYVDTGLTASRAYIPTLDFSFDRSEDGFEEVMIYYHIQEFRKYLRDALGFLVELRQVLADAHASEEDNSWYSPLVSAIFFGDGGVDDAEDAYLVIHEYFHAVMFEVVREPCFSAERDAISEGTADYFAASFYAAHDFMPETVAQWDGIRNSPIGVRRVDSTKVYPADFVGESHDDGEIWSSALWHMRSAVGEIVAGRLVLEAMFYLDGASQFSEALEALLLADEALYGGSHADAITTAFADRGIVVQSPMEIGDVRNGTLSAGDLTMEDGTYYDQYAFNATAGQVVKITLESDAFDAYLVLLDPYFNTLADGDDLPDGSTNSQIVLKIPYDGGYRIFANCYDRGDTGPYTLRLLAGSLSEGTPQRTSIAYGRQVSGNLGSGDFTLLSGTAYDDYSLSGHVGQQIRAIMTSSMMDAYLELYDEGGDLLVTSNFGYDVRLYYTLPDDQYYTLSVNQSFAVAGDYTLLLSSSDPQLQIGEIISGRLDSNDLQFNFDDSYFDPYQFEGEAGQTFSIKLYSNEFDAYLMVYNPYYESILQADDASFSNTNAVAEEFQINIPGTYFVIANSYQANETGSYRLCAAPLNVTDTDGDGFSDRVEMAENTNPLDPSSTPPDADGDFIPDTMDTDNDNDGMPDVDELIAGTDPRDPHSIFAVVDVSVADGEFTVRWSSVPDYLYAVHRSTDLVNWTIVQPDVASQGDETSWTESDPVAEPAAFYRIEVIPVLPSR
jgi:hypothetical protein